MDKCLRSDIGTYRDTIEVVIPILSRRTDSEMLEPRLVRVRVWLSFLLSVETRILLFKITAFGVFISTIYL